MVCSLREGFGFIRCVEREQTMFFHFAEVLRLGHELSIGDEVPLKAMHLTSLLKRSVFFLNYIKTN